MMADVCMRYVGKGSPWAFVAVYSGRYTRIYRNPELHMSFPLVCIQSRGPLAKVWQCQQGILYFLTHNSE